MPFEPKPLQPERSARDLYGYEMRSRREQAGMSLVRLAGIVNHSKSVLGRVETAESMPPPELSAALDSAFGTDGVFTRLYPLARKEEFPDRYKRFMQLAAHAAVHESYTAAVPGLLQIESYARALMATGNPHGSDQELNDKVTARLNRQKRLHGVTPGRYWFILDETALRRTIGGPHVMRDQMAALLTMSTLSHVTIQVLPFTSGQHAEFGGSLTLTIQVLPFTSGQHAEFGGSLTLLTTSERSLVAYVEGSRSGELEDEPEKLAVLRESYDLLRAQALSPGDSVAMINAAQEGYERDAA
ncbi:helix-turn-helix transcriptional regulator [Kitasatospora sp. MAP5-34]|uniref:helix-turn-helix domain-containing protein n=1 Tax=Kitasatospora sp. MAP5-34 TaxID=3035102 RepID=UPI002475571D|nr:helix-turn-helix transcriptional regulator [Kitasatospora sp. MAP5-34]MDH6579493.1 transcriptional regulator with XRE-family HTH domain [Kitasatospora sp. MAP5-34]